MTSLLVTTTSRAKTPCADVDPEIFFQSSTRDEAKKICRSCPVREACLQDALVFDDLRGVWGGQSKTQRRRVQLKEELPTRSVIDRDLMPVGVASPAGSPPQAPPAREARRGPVRGTVRGDQPGTGALGRPLAQIPQRTPQSSLMDIELPREQAEGSASGRSLASIPERPAETSLMNIALPHPVQQKQAAGTEHGKRSPRERPTPAVPPKNGGTRPGGNKRTARPRTLTDQARTFRAEQS